MKVPEPSLVRLPLPLMAPEKVVLALLPPTVRVPNDELALLIVRLPLPCNPPKVALASVEEAARSGANVMPRILAAVEASATVGEISDAMRRVFGEYKEAVVI